MNTWKKAVGLAVMAAMAVGLIGCGGQQEGSKSTGGKEKSTLNRICCGKHDGNVESA